MSARDHALVRQLPNSLSLARLCAVPVFIGLFVHAGGRHFNDNPDTLVPGLIFIGAAITDFLDGQIARRARVMSQFGKLADPLADRLLVASAAVLVSLYDTRLVDWAFLIVVARDVLAILGVILVRRRISPNVTIVGKIGTACMMGGLALLMIVAHSMSWPVWLFWIGVAFSLVAFADYVLRYRWALRHKPPRGPHTGAVV